MKLSRIRVPPGRQIGSNPLGQSTLEATIALIAAVVLLLGITQVFVWVNKMMAERHQAYRATRVNASAPVEFYQPKNLDIFGTQGE